MGVWRGVHPNGQRATWTQGRGTSGGVRAWGCFISIEAFMVSSFLTCIFCEWWSIRSAVALLLTRMCCVLVGNGYVRKRGGLFVDICIDLDIAPPFPTTSFSAHEGETDSSF